ncbi:Glycosyl transferases group 1 [Candidatus Pseudomonas adelgestsugas]|uniref:Glycosyl transferases group 1 n=2 Tax=Candidatus Pseudomonas adelgestsugas TaxID=1302376 RepID=A0ABX5R9B2_9PSED|nr:Glycosyl transferases group 1 [Candidatus Pseudomonas adelgestsugas]
MCLQNSMIFKLAIIGTVGLPAKYGGWETLSEQLIIYLDQKYEISLYCSSMSYASQLVKYRNANLIYLPLQANGVQSIFYDIVSMLHAYRKNDVLLILGVSGCVALPFLKLLTNNKIVVNIDGYEWKRTKWSALAKKFLKFSEAVAVKYSDAIITDNKVIQDYVRSEYRRESTLITYGGDHAITSILSKSDLQRYPLLAQPYAFSVCRIEPENNIHVIIEAFNTSSLPLIIVGNWKYSEYGKVLQDKYANKQHLHLLDSIYNSDELNLLRSNATIYIHGHSVGGTNPSLVEAMWLSLPIIAFDVSFNRISTEGCAKFFSSSQALIDSAVNLFANQAERAQLSKKMHEIAVRRYRWDSISAQYDNLFKSLLLSNEG